MKQRLKKVYQKLIGTKLKHYLKFSNITNIHQIPKIKKIVINRRVGAQSLKMVETLRLELSYISGQSGMITHSRSSVAGFKIRNKVPVGIIVTLRGERMYAFFDRLVNLRLPRIRDFRGVSTRNFDGDGNFNIGLTEQLIFPEISYEQINQLCGIDISTVISSKVDLQSKVLLIILGIPFRE
uniref:Large ribosomal subunit protein uL5c n=1 Tax=Lepidodinium chlorophorum TaxID=107758 RepID=A0A0F7R601_LEPCH|nr:ribosomal protein L5 [Lepidodinium chlorophorum]BAR72302.1 ribosomal protein L5 [Lepidodinium chlorophorum]